MGIIRGQQSDVVWLSPAFESFSIMQNVNGPKIVTEKRARSLPMIDFVASITRCELTGDFFSL